MKLNWNTTLQTEMSWFIKKWRGVSCLHKTLKAVLLYCSGLDMSPYYCGPTSDVGPQPVYDLFAVINHHGGMLGGHYTAFARCTDTVETRKSEVGLYLLLLLVSSSSKMAQPP